MTTKDYSTLASAIFATIAMLQLLRAVSGWQIMLKGLLVPIWASWVACGAFLALALLGLSASGVLEVG
jgi:hypothetical protein